MVFFFFFFFFFPWCLRFVANIGTRTETTVVTTTITPSPVEALLRQQYASENGREPAQGDDVPMYAWPCDVDRYAEVCSCLGFPATTVTELAWTAIETLTLTKTQTLSGSPVFPNVTRSLASSWQVSIGPGAPNTATTSGSSSVLSSSPSSNQRPSYAPPPLTTSAISATSSSSWLSTGSSRPSLTPSISMPNNTSHSSLGGNSTLAPLSSSPNYTLPEPSPMVAKRSLFERTVRRLPQPFSQCHLPFNKDDHANSVIRISVFQLEHFRHIWLIFCSEYPAPYPEFDDNVRDYH
ncbi:hypothetical protein JOL62DRAFT_268458 [Phyllosticta paracitricarpa]|uniref:Uncharacterized protein n=1 Tax=Phyllosticta paracitricarpa TaxID=2016321 RepID=A0ABR1MXH2_9PEZI